MADENTTEKLTRLCPCCGQEVSLTEFRVLTESDEEAFLMSMLGNVPFERTYKFLKGRISITVKALMPDQAYRHVTLSSSLVQKFKDLTAGYGQIVMITSLIEQLFMVKALDLNVHGTITHKDVFTPDELLDTLEYYKPADPEKNARFLQDTVRKLTEVLTAGTSVPLNIISEAVARHKLLVEKLIAKCYDEDFYQGVEQQS